MSEKKNQEDFLEGFVSNFNLENAIPIESPLANSYGLNLTDPARISYEYGEVQIEVVGKLEESNPKHLRVTLIIKRKDNPSAVNIHRSTQVDLFNSAQVQKLIKDASAVIKLEQLKLREALAELTERLDRYRKERPFLIQSESESETFQIEDSKAAKAFLKKPNLLNQLRKKLEEAGIVDVSLGVQLFILGLSRLTTEPLHVIVQGKMLQAHEFFTAFKEVIPVEQLREATSMSKNALSYAPQKGYWRNKTLLLHKLQSLFHKESVLQEYIRQGEVRRIVTEADRQSATYKSTEKLVKEHFQIVGYTSIDSHPIFNAPNLICLPQSETKTLTEKFYLKEIWEFSGQTEQSLIEKSRLLLQDVQRHLKPYRVINPYLDQIDFQAFFGEDLKAFRRYMKITSLITLLHQEQAVRRKKEGKQFLEVEPEHMLQALELFECLWLLPEEQLYFSVSSTFNSLKKRHLKKHKRAAKTAAFKPREYRPKGMAFSTFSKHIKQLEEYNKIKRVGGSFRGGFEYEIVEWQSSGEKIKQYQQLIKELKNLRS
jgi:DNA primase